MEPGSFDALINFLMGQDPWFLLIVFLLVRGEVRTKQVLDAMALLDQLKAPPASGSKTPQS